MSNVLQDLNLYLVGLMGTGKTTVGLTLAHQLKYRFFDTDTLIERVSQQAIADIFANQGEAYFRDLEHQVLSEVAACTRSVIATGGGIILKSENWGYLRHGLIVWLDAPISLLVERLREDNTRPLLHNEDLGGKLNELLEQRQGLYAEADLQIKIEKGQTPEAITAHILEQLPRVLTPANQSDPGLQNLN